MKIFSAFYGKAIWLSCSVKLFWFVYANLFVRRRVFEREQGTEEAVWTQGTGRNRRLTNCVICAAYRMTKGLTNKENKMGWACGMYEEKRNTSGFGGEDIICSHTSAGFLQTHQMTVSKTELPFSYHTTSLLHLCHYVTHEQYNFP